MTDDIPHQNDHEGLRGTDRLILGIVLGVNTFWLFAQTTRVARRRQGGTPS